jgi:hypothetical protein
MIGMDIGASDSDITSTLLLSITIAPFRSFFANSNELTDSLCAMGSEKTRMIQD